MTKLLYLAPSTAVLVVEDNIGCVQSEEEISTDLIEMGDLLKVAFLAVTHHIYLPEIQRMQKSAGWMFCEHLHQYVGEVTKLCFDRHYLCSNMHAMALVSVQNIQ